MLHLAHAYSCRKLCSIYRSLNTFGPVDIFANSVAPDETDHNEPSHQDLHCLPFYSWFTSDPRQHEMCPEVGRVYF